MIIQIADAVPAIQFEASDDANFVWVCTDAYGELFVADDGDAAMRWALGRVRPMIRGHQVRRKTAHS